MVGYAPVRKARVRASSPMIPTPISASSSRVRFHSSSSSTSSQRPNTLNAFVCFLLRNLDMGHIYYRMILLKSQVFITQGDTDGQTFEQKMLPQTWCPPDFCQSQKKVYISGSVNTQTSLIKSTKRLQFILVNHSLTFNLPPHNVTRLKHRFTVAVKPNQLFCCVYTENSHITK